MQEPIGAERTVHVEQVMGTAVSFSLRPGGEHAAAVQEAVAWLHEVDARFSTYRPDSEVSRLDGASSAHRWSADFREVFETCSMLRDASGGAFDAEYGGRFDPSAYVKGWSVDRAARILEAHGCGDWSINAGGDVLVSAPATAAAWRIGVQHPLNRDAVAMVLHSRGLAVATSGRYERGDHLIDPRTGAPARDAVSVTVCGPRLGLADAYATAAFVMGEAGPRWVAGIDGYESWTVFDGGRVVATAGFPQMVQGVPLSVSPASAPAERGL